MNNIDIKQAEHIDSTSDNSLDITNMEKQKLNLVVELYHLENDENKNIAVVLWIGDSKLYKINDLNTFFKVHLNDSKSLKLNEKFTYDSNVHTFSSKDKRILKTLDECFNSKFNEEKSMIFKTRDKIFLRDNEMLQILKLLEGKKFLFNKDKNRETIYIKKKNMPLCFDVKKLSSFLIVSHSENTPISLTANGEFFYFNNAIYAPNISQRETYLPFYKKLISSKTNSITIYKELNEIAFNSFFDDIDKCDASVILKEEVSYKNRSDSLNVKFYLDFINDKITLNVKFVYDKIEVDPFNKNKYLASKLVQNRNLKKEFYIFDIIKGLNFEMTNYYFTLTDTDTIVEFLEKGILQLKEFGEIHKSDSFKELRFYKPSDYKATVNINKNSLLEFTFGIDGISSYDVNSIIKSIKENKTNYSIGNGRFIDLKENSIKNISNLLNYLDVKEVNTLKNTYYASKFNALYVDKILKDSNIKTNGNSMYLELINKIKNVSQKDWIPEGDLQNTMRDYQKEGLKWLKTLYTYGFGGILADEMGLGKTLQAISLICSYVKEHENIDKKPILVVCPASLVYNWIDEIEKFAPHIKAGAVYGHAGERIKLLRDFHEFDVIITSYSIINKDFQLYYNKEFSICFIDEAQNIKNPRSKAAKTIKALKTDSRFALTGTPIENRLEELWSIFDFILPGYLMSNKEFTSRYIEPIERNSISALQALNKHTEPFILRRYKKDVIKELPDKIEKNMYIELTNEQKTVYAAYNSVLRNEILNKISIDGLNQSKIHLLGGLAKLKQICCDPSIVLDDYEGESAKMLALDEIIEESIHSGNRILIFSQFTTVLKKIAVRFSKNNIDYFYLDGKTPSKQRVSLSKRFNEGEKDVFLVSLKAGGTGLNLTGANTVIHFDLWWNTSVEAQATDRAHRIGQNKTVEVIKFITKGTIEEKILEIQKKKRNLIENIIDDNDMAKSIISEMNAEDIENLFT